jgi:hypothetical protein
MPFMDENVITPLTASTQVNVNTKGILKIDGFYKTPYTEDIVFSTETTGSITDGKSLSFVGIPLCNSDNATFSWKGVFSSAINFTLLRSLRASTVTLADIFCPL